MEKNEESIGTLLLMFAEEEGKAIACQELPIVIKRLTNLEAGLVGHPFKHEAVKIVLALLNVAEGALDCLPQTDTVSNPVN